MSENKKGEKTTGKYGVDMGDRGIYDKRNKLNNMTGREWVNRKDACSLGNYESSLGLLSTMRWF